MQDRVLHFLFGFTAHLENKPQDVRSESITLTLGGLLVSGSLITPTTYFKLLMDGALHDAFEKASSLGAAISVEEDAEEFIHLSNARFWTPGNPYPFPSIDYPGVLWRGKINSIQGYTIGELAPRPVN